MSGRNIHKYGQHFLTDSRVIEAIIGAVPVEAASVVEIGPGRGALTAHLLARGREQFCAVEIDPDMQKVLLARWPELNGRVYLADFMRFDLAQLPQISTFFVANLPYIDAADILDKVLSWAHTSGAVFMFQKEQAQRILAHAGSAAYGPISVLSQVRAEVHSVVKAGPYCFNPPPKVQSEVLAFSAKEWPFPRAQYAAFARLVKDAFLHRRKKMYNSLVLCGWDKAHTSAALAQAGLSETVRAEQVPLSGFLALHCAYHK